MQMSKYEVLRLNDCPVTQYLNLLEYPHCEKKNLRVIEKDFSRSSIPFHVSSSEHDWAKPGDCRRFRSRIASGRAFNDRIFTECKLSFLIGGKGMEKGKKNI